MISKLPARSFSTPSRAMATGSASVLPKGILAFVAFCLSWSKAPARNVSAHTNPVLNPFFWWSAYFVQVVVFPLPRPTNITT
eukprot:19888_1